MIPKSNRPGPFYPRPYPCAQLELKTVTCCCCCCRCFPVLEPTEARKKAKEGTPEGEVAGASLSASSSRVHPSPISASAAKRGASDKVCFGFGFGSMCMY
jgi:hypothetical protein